MATWSDLETELNRWRAAGATATFWWRDDDIDAPSDALDRLLGLSERFEVPIHLAAVPVALNSDLADRLAGCTEVYVMQHGFAHINHEPPGHGASEIGIHRDLELQLGDLREGWRRLVAAGIPNLLPGLVPPWNRIAETTLPHLPGLNYRLLAAFDGPTPHAPVPGLLQINAHFDPIRWKGGATFRGVEATLGHLVAHLARRRLGEVESALPTGLLTHHLQADDDTWDFVETLLDRTARSSGAEWIRLSSILDAV